MLFCYTLHVSFWPSSSTFSLLLLFTVVCSLNLSFVKGKVRHIHRSGTNSIFHNTKPHTHITKRVKKRCDWALIFSIRHHFLYGSCIRLFSSSTIFISPPFLLFFVLFCFLCSLWGTVIIKEKKKCLIRDGNLWLLLFFLLFVCVSLSLSLWCGLVALS